MPAELIKPRYTSDVAMKKPSVATVLDADDAHDRQMVKNHARAVASQLSTQIRLENVAHILVAVAATMDTSVKQFHAHATHGSERLDREKTMDNEVADFGEQAIAQIKDTYLRLLQAGGEYLVEKAGADIEEKIAIAPPPPAAPPTVIVQQAGPKLRPANLFESGKTKYVIDD